MSCMVFFWKGALLALDLTFQVAHLEKWVDNPANIYMRIFAHAHISASFRISRIRMAIPIPNTWNAQVDHMEKWVNNPAPSLLPPRSREGATDDIWEMVHSKVLPEQFHPSSGCVNKHCKSAKLPWHHTFLSFCLFVMTKNIILAGLKLSFIAAFTSRWPILFSRKKPSTVCSVHKYRDMWPNDRARGQNTPTSDFWLSMLNLSLSGFQKSFPVPIFEFKVEHTLTLAEWEWPPLLFQSKSVTESKTIKCRWGRNYNMEERLNAVFDLFAKWGHENYIGKCYI